MPRIKRWTLPLLGTLVLVAGIASCDGHDITREDVCDEAAIAAASRVYECTGNIDDSNAAHDSLRARPCIASEAPADRLQPKPGEGLDFSCPRETLAVSCGAVAAAPRSPERWTPASCRRVFEGAGNLSDAGLDGRSP
ncbi:MAG: hypothetical protein IPG50_05015 [Myxococcales bacterium]|nr:hypothetical protein [Myxococcales bacterium]